MKCISYRVAVGVPRFVIAVLNGAEFGVNDHTQLRCVYFFVDKLCQVFKDDRIREFFIVQNIAGGAIVDVHPVNEFLNQLFSQASLQEVLKRIHFSLLDDRFVFSDTALSTSLLSTVTCPFICMGYCSTYDDYFMFNIAEGIKYFGYCSTYAD